MKALLATGVAALAVAGAAAAKTSALPNPCTLLKTVHAEKTLAAGATVKPGTLKKYGSGALESDYCSETVGALTVSISVARNGGGFGGINVTSQTHPSGLGAGATLIVGKALGSNKPVDFLDFHKGTTYVSVGANGANPAKLTALARQVYKLIH